MADSQFVTLKLESGNYLRFQVDTGAQCNVVPLDLYRKATKDYKLVQVSPTKPKITAYGGTEIPVVGKVLLRVWRGKFKCRLDCKIVDQENIRPLLGRKACIGMGIVAYLDNDKQTCHWDLRSVHRVLACHSRRIVIVPDYLQNAVWSL